MRKHLVLSMMVLFGLFLFGAVASAEDTKPVFSKLMVFPLADPSGKIDAKALAAFRKEFIETFTKMRNSVGAMTEEEATSGLAVANKTFPDDKLCVLPLCQQKVLESTEANHLVSLKIVPEEDGTFSVIAKYSHKKMALLQNDAKTGWDGKGLSGLVAAKRLAFRLVLALDKDDSDKNRKELMKKAQLSEEELKADTKEVKMPEKKKKDFDPGKAATDKVNKGK